MGYPHTDSDQSGLAEELTIESIFDVDSTAPDETQRTVQRYLS